MNKSRERDTVVTHHVTTDWNSGMHFTARSDHNDLMMESANVTEGTTAGWPPKKLMLAALTGCTGMDVVSFLTKMRVPFSHVRISAEAKLTDEHPKIYHSVHLIYRIGAQNTYREQVEKAVSLSQNKYCGVSAMFRKFARVSYEIILDSTATE